MKAIKRLSSVFFCGLLISCVFQILIIRPSYSAAPTITSVTPDTGTTTSSTRVTITGENFEPGAKVSLLSGGPLLVDANDVSGYVHISGNYAYVAAGRSGLKVLDISTFSSPEIVGSIANIGSADKVYVYGDYAYVTVNGKEEFATSMLQVIDIRDPASPELAASIIAPGSIEYVSDDYVYLTGSSPAWTGKLGSLTIVDVSDPTSPKIAGSYDTPGNAYGVQVSDSYAYVTYVTPWCCGYFGGAGLLVIDISDPATPVTIGAYETPGNAFDVHVSGNYAYVAAGQAGLLVVDISDPASPTLVGSFATLGSTYQDISVSGSADGITGSVSSVYVTGDYAYLAGEPGLLVIDVSEPRLPTLVGFHDIQDVKLFNPYYDYGNSNSNYVPKFNVYVANKYAYVSDNKGMLLIDVSNPVNPAFVGTAQTVGDASGLHVAGDYAYVNALTQDEIHLFLNLSVINISEPKNIEVVSKFSDSFFISSIFGPHYPDLYVEGNYVYQPFDWPPELKIIDISDPALPALAGSFVFGFPSNTNYQYRVGDVFISGNYAYVTLIKGGEFEGAYSTRLWIIDISDPKVPTKISSISVPVGRRGIHGVYVSGDFAYLASGEDRLVVVDINDPAAPFIVGSYDTPGSARDVYVSGNYAYLADGEAGLSVVDISDTSAPLLVGTYDTPGDAKRLHVSGHYAYLADGSSGLRVLNISDPISPFLADVVDTPHIANDVYASGGYAYLANGFSGFIMTATHDSVTDINVLNSTTITATFPADLPKGAYHVLVTNPGGQTDEAYLYNSFKAELLPASESKNKCCMKHYHKGRKSKKGHKGKKHE